MVAGRLVTPSTTLPNIRTETIAEMCFDQPGERVLIGLVCLVGGWDIIVEHVDRQSDTLTFGVISAALFGFDSELPILILVDVESCQSGGDLRVG